MNTKEIQAIIKLVRELNELKHKNEPQEKFLEALKGINQDNQSLNQIVQNDLLIVNTSLSESHNSINGIRIKPEDWIEIGIRLGDKWKNKDKGNSDNDRLTVK